MPCFVLPTYKAIEENPLRLVTSYKIIALQLSLLHSLGENYCRILHLQILQVLTFCSNIINHHIHNSDETTKY